MTPGGRYLVGVSAVAAAALLLSFVLPRDARTGVWLATALALIVQAPLGWWVVRAIGTERLQLVWAVGIAARFALVAACGLVVAPMVRLALAAALVAPVFDATARVVARGQAAGRPPRGFAAAMEAMVLYIRQEVILANVGPHGEGYVNYLLTVFFFILTCNLLGLLP